MKLAGEICDNISIWWTLVVEYGISLLGSSPAFAQIQNVKVSVIIDRLFDKQVSSLILNILLHH